jgi:hypothetical protein
VVNWNRQVFPEIVDQLKILKDQGIVPTLRSMYYRLLSLGVFDKGPKYADQALSEHTARWRKNSIFNPHVKYQLPIDCFADDTRKVIRTWSNYRAPEKYIQELIESIRSFPQNYVGGIPRWYKQQHYVEIWVEKKAMIGTLQNIVGDRQIRIVPLSGYSSVTFMHDNMKRLEENVIGRGSGLVHVLYLGDLDPSGSDIVTNIEVALNEYELEDHVDFQHIAVSESQVDAWNLPYNPTPEKEKKLEQDPRSKHFKRKHGKLFQYEIDSLPALRPTEFKNLILEPIDKWFDNKIYEEVRSDSIYSEKELKRIQKEGLIKLYNEIIKK